MNRWRKIAILSHTLPPVSNGQSIALERLLDTVPKDAYCLISDDAVSGSTLKGEFFQIPKSPQLPFEKLFRSIIGPINIIISIFWWASQLTRILRRTGCRGIVACTGDVHEFPAVWLAARRTKTDVFFHVFDWYQYKYATIGGSKGRFMRWLACRLERPLLRSATRVLVPNEFLQNEFRERYGIESTIIRNPTSFRPNATRNDCSLDRRYKESAAPIRIVYTGAVYDAHIDAFRNLFSAISKIGNSRIQLELYADETREMLERHGLRGTFRLYPRVSLEHVQEIQQRADILFLPLAFHSPYPEVIMTSAPGKLGDYLAAGRPILVHAPADSFVNWYFQKYRCGVTIPHHDSEVLEEALRRITESPETCDDLVANALRKSLDFQSETVKEVFSEIVWGPRPQEARDFDDFLSSK